MTTALAADVARLDAGASFADRSDRGVVLVSGPDAFSFLQALVSADLDPLTDGTGTDCLLLTPNGKLGVVFRLLRAGDTAALDCDPGLSTPLAESLLKFRIRVQAEVFDATGDVAMLSFVGGSVPAEVPEALHAFVVADDAVQLVRTRHGYDLVGPRSAIEHRVEQFAAQGITAAPAEAYEAWRIDRAVPVQPFDLDDSTIPQEAFLEQYAVSFTKGCFLGQELVCRIDSRGHVNRFLRRLEIDGVRPVPGAEIVVGTGDDEKVVGALTSVTPEGVAPVALGYVRREVEPPAEVTLRWHGGSSTARIPA